MSYVLGLDPGLAHLGYAVVDDKNYTLAELGLIVTTKSQRLLAGQDFFERTKIMARRLGSMADRIKPAAVVMEAFSYMRQAKAVAMLAVSHGQVAQLCEDLDLPLVVISRGDVMQHLELKITSRGRANRKKEIKTKVVDFAMKRWPKADWKQFKKADLEHPADAAVTVLAALEAGRYSKARREYETRLIVTGEDS